jgi:hypothetical protein
MEVKYLRRLLNVNRGKVKVNSFYAHHEGVWGSAGRYQNLLILGEL